MSTIGRTLGALAMLLAPMIAIGGAVDDANVDPEPILVASESRIVLHLDGAAAGGVARITLRDGGVANILQESGKGLQITARQVGPGVVVVNITEILGKGLAKDGDVESVDAYGKAYAPISLGIGEAKAVRELGLTISASFETVTKAATHAPVCTDGSIATSAGAKAEDQCCVRCGSVTVCAFCVQLSCGWCCAP